MNKLLPLLFSFMLILPLATGCTDTNPNSKHEGTDAKKEQVELTISAAASLQDALNEIKTTFEKDHSNITLTFNYGASGALQTQISQGAPVDLFISAAEDKFDQLMDEGLIDKDAEIDLVGNEIVLVVPNDSTKRIHDFKDLTKAEKISIGTPETVPAGQYAKETMENIKVWENVEDKIVFAKDVRQVLTYVETGNVDAGIVYKTDAKTSDKAKIVAIATEDTHTPIIYPMGIINKTKHIEEAQLFNDYLQKKESLEILKKYGFKNL